MVDLLDGIVLTTDSDTSGPTCSSWAPTVFNPANANDADPSTYSHRNSTVKNGPCTYQTIWIADLGSAQTAAGYHVHTNHPGYWSVEHASSPAGPWTSEAEFDATDGDPYLSNWLNEGTFADPVSARYWRLVHSYDQPGLTFMQAVTLFTWELDAGTPGPDPEPPDPSVPDWTPPEPGRAIVEIYVDDPEGAKWDEAEWDEAVWPAALWVPIDYASTRVAVTDGTDEGSKGILSTPRASKFDVDTFDPERDLDPNNPDSPFAGQLVPGLPIRVRHRSTVLRTARVRRVEWSFDLEGGRITAANLISDLANATLPPTTDLGDTLYERAADAIAAVDLPFRVLAPTAAGDPTLVPYTPDANNVWRVILEAAQSVLWVPYVNEHNELGFVPWADGIERGRVLASDELIDLVSWSDAEGLYSAVRALDSVSMTVEERAATPTPSWGRRVYDDREDVPTIDADSWAAAVLADRRDHRLRYRPGTLRPLDADHVETLGTLRVLEGVDIDHPQADPAIDVHVRILGRWLEAVDDTHDDDVVRTRWRFSYSVSAAPPALLVADQDETLYLLDDPTETDNLTTG